MQNIEDFIKQQTAELDAKIKEHQRKLDAVRELRDARSIEGWSKSQGQRQLLFPSVDKQSADMSTLVDWDTLAESFARS